jgi:hypothetical protein
MIRCISLLQPLTLCKPSCYSIAVTAISKVELVVQRIATAASTPTLPLAAAAAPSLPTPPLQPLRLRVVRPKGRHAEEHKSMTSLQVRAFGCLSNVWIAMGHC